MPDADGLEMLAQRIRDLRADAVIEVTHNHGQAMIEVAPDANREALVVLSEQGYSFLSSLHGVDYYPDEPRLGVHYQLLDLDRVDRVGVKLRVTLDDPAVASVVDLFPTADHHEREVYDMFGVVFEGHPDLRRILMPEDYQGHPQRRDFPTGGEPVIFTYNEPQTPGWTQ